MDPSEADHFYNHLPNVLSDSHLDRRNRPSTSLPKRRSFGTLGALGEEARNFKKRASQLIIEVPVDKLRRLRLSESSGINSLQRETQHFVELNKTNDFSERLFQYVIQTNYEVFTLIANGNNQSLSNGEEELLNYTSVHPEFNLPSFFQQGGFECWQILKICSFAGVEFNCCEWAKVVYTDLGRCLTIDLSKEEARIKQKVAGVNSGLQLILDSHLEEQFDGTGGEPDPIFANGFENGFRYYIHAKDTIPHVVSEGISVSPGARVYSAVSASNYQLLDSNHWGNCTRDWVSEYSTPLAYSAVNCMSLCKAKYFSGQCGCSPFLYNIDNESITCTPFETFNCFPVDEKSPFTLPQCTECVMECSSWRYTAYNSYGQGFSNGALRWIQKKNESWTASHVRENFVTINVFFREMSYTKYTQKAGITFTEILSDLGGNMGMFLGMSVITMIETVIYITKISWIAISKKRRQYMFDKKKMEENSAREMTETITRFRSLAQLSHLEEEITVPRNKIRRLGRRLKDSFRKPMRMNRIRPKRRERVDTIDEEEPSAPNSPQQAEAAKKRFLDNLYTNALFGQGKAQENGEGKGSVVELKIDLKALDARASTSSDVNVLVPQCEYVSRKNTTMTEERRRTPSFYLNLPDDLFKEYQK